MQSAVCRCLVVLLLLLYSAPVIGAERIPLRVQLVLQKVGPLMEQKKYDQAGQLLSDFRTRAGENDESVYNHPHINFTLGNCRYLQGKLNEAAACYRRVVERDTDHQSGWGNLGRVAYDLGSYPEASKAFLRAYELSDKQKGDYLYFAGATMLMAEHHQQALKLFELLLSAHQEQIRLSWLENYVYTLLALDLNKKALPSIRKLADGYQGKKQRQWREILLQQYMQLGMLNKAREYGVELSREEPDEPLWWKLLTHVYLQKDKPEQALNALIIYSFLTPLKDKEKKLLADLHLQQGIPVQAVGSYESYLQSNRDEQVLTRLVYAYMELGRLETGLEKIQQYAPKAKHGKLCMLKGDILYQLKRYREAATTFEGVAEEKGRADTGRAWLMVGYCCWQMQEVGRSIKAFEYAANSKRFKKEASRALKRLQDTPAEQGGRSREHNPSL